MDHQGLKVYKIYLNDDPGMTLTYFTAMSNLVLIANCALYKTHRKVSVYMTIGPLVLPSKPKSNSVSKNYIESVINLAKIDRSPFLKLWKRLAGCIPRPRDSSESDLVDSAFYRVYGFIQTPSTFKRFYRSIG